MKKVLFLLALVCILQVSMVRGAEVLNAVDLNVVMVNQDPYMAEPQSYVNLLFKLENEGTQEAKNVVFEMVPEFPFSLDPGQEAVKELGNIKGLQMDENAYLIKYKVRVDEDALDGENDITIRYKHDGSAGYYSKSFNVTVSDPKTDFDVVLQDSSESSITLALANIGTNTAYSVTVRVPEQDDFRTTGISSSILGNLNEADYTLVTFDIVPNYQTGVWGNQDAEKALLVEIFYTDEIGVRRVVQKEVPVSGYSGYLTANATDQGTRTRTFQQQVNTTQWLEYVGLGVAGAAIAGFFLYRRHKKKVKK